MKLAKNEKGQVLLIVVLTMVVALTVGLSLVSRTITNIRISRQNDESQRAFQAAEAGIDQALAQIPQATTTTIADVFGNNSEYETTIDSLEGTELLLLAGDEVPQDVGADVWLSDYSEDPLILYQNPMDSGGGSANITVYWGTSDQTTCISGGDDQTRPALEILILSGADLANPTLEKRVYDPCLRLSSPNAALTGSPIRTIDGTAFSYSTDTINIANGRLMKVIPIYNSGMIGVVSDTAFPSQGSIIESTGQSGETVRKVSLFSSYPQIPLEIFPYAIVSQ